MKVYADRRRVIGKRDPMIYGHFIEHFHRQIYGGVFDPGNSLSGEDGLREDVLDAMKRIKVPVLRWPGGCFVSSYHWKEGVGRDRKPSFNKSWRVVEPNTFGTDEYIAMCRRIGCEPYICTNAGTGTPEEMSDWVEYCNLDHEGRWSEMRADNGHEKPYGVRYWSIGNENYGSWEIGARTSEEWGHLTAESAKMMKRVDPKIQLSAAALTDPDWNLNLLRNCGPYLDWISIHDYWDPIHETNDKAPYETVLTYTKDIGASVRKVRGLLEALGLEKQIRIAYDEWNLRQWYHPGIMGLKQAETKEEYLIPRDRNDDNSTYTMADVVFSACFLNMVNRSCDIVGMANFAPIVNTRGCIYTYPEGIVLRGTYYVFDLYVNKLGDIVLDTVTDGETEAVWAIETSETVRPNEAARTVETSETARPNEAARAIETGRTHEMECPSGSAPTGTYLGLDRKPVEVELLDILVTAFSDRRGYAIAAVNKDPVRQLSFNLDLDYSGEAEISILNGESTESYNDVGKNGISVKTKKLGKYTRGMTLSLEPHSVNVITIA